MIIPFYSRKTHSSFPNQFIVSICHTFAVSIRESTDKRWFCLFGSKAVLEKTGGRRWLKRPCFAFLYSLTSLTALCRSGHRLLHARQVILGKIRVLLVDTRYKICGLAWLGYTDWA